MAKKKSKRSYSKNRASARPGYEVYLEEYEKLSNKNAMRSKKLSENIYNLIVDATKNKLKITGQKVPPNLSKNIARQQRAVSEKQLKAVRKGYKAMSEDISLMSGLDYNEQKRVEKLANMSLKDMRMLNREELFQLSDIKSISYSEYIPDSPKEIKLSFI